MEIGGKETHGIETKKAMEKQNKILIVNVAWIFATATLLVLIDPEFCETHT